MTRRFPIACVAAALVVAAPAAAEPLTIVKATGVVADGVNTANPRILPGATLDLTLLVTNPLGNAAVPVRRVVVSDPIPDTVKLRVRDLGAANSGPVEFVDGNLLKLGLIGSGLSYSWAGAASTMDALEFFDGISWAYVPVADAAGYDDKVRAIRMTLVGTQVTGSSFRLRYRVIVK